jgi:hypothetical protein
LTLSVRDEIKRVCRSLITLDDNPPVDGHRAFAAKVEALAGAIQHLAQLKLVRPAMIALNNLAVSLERRSPHVSEDAEAAREALADLLADPTVGIDTNKMRRDVAAALDARGVSRCPRCNDNRFSIDILSLLVRPYPGEYTNPPPHLPVTLLTCQGCGFVATHNLEMLLGRKLEGD